MNIYKQLYSSIIVGSLTMIGCYYSFQLYRKYKYMIGLLNNTSIPSNINPTVVVEDGHMVIHYTYQNEKYKLFVPYNQSMVAKTAQYVVVGTNEEGKEIPLTQQPGVPYVVTPDDLGLQNITVYDLDEDEKRIYYSTQPGYGLISE